MISYIVIRTGGREEKSVDDTCTDGLDNRRKI